VSQAAGYSVGQGGPVSDRVQALRAALEEKLESFYYSAARIRDLVREIPELEKFDCREITIVRNKLIEHADLAESDTFGYGTNGPTVKPFHTPGSGMD
jgi:hypothetical protein